MSKESDPTLKNEDGFEEWQTVPNIDECRFVILKIIEQAVRDFIALEHSTAPIEQYGYETAVDFLFDDDYRINWGDEEKSLTDLLDFLDIDIDWFREKVLEAKDRKLGNFEIS